MGSAMAKMPRNEPSSASNTVVLLAAFSVFICSSVSWVMVIPWVSKKAMVPRNTFLPLSSPDMPLPGCAWKDCTVLSVRFFLCAASRMAAASGCSLALSKEAACWSRVSWLWFAWGIISMSLGFPSVRVPVLSTTNVVMLPSISSASASLMSTPFCAPRPTPTMMDTGVARPSAQGHAMISTATALMSPWLSRGSLPQSAQMRKVRSAAIMTAGTKMPETRSAVFWIGALLCWAFFTRSMIWDKSMSEPTFSARMMKVPCWFRVPPVTGSWGFFPTGMGSPLIMDSSMSLDPSSIVPSTGTFDPGCTRRVSPCCTACKGMVWSPPGSMRRAVLGVWSMSARSAWPVFVWARVSRTCPSRIRVMMTAADSK